MWDSSWFCQGRWVDLGSVVQVSGVEALDEMLLARLAGGYTPLWCCGYYIYPLSTVVYLFVFLAWV